MGKIGKELNIDFVVSTGDNFYDNGLTGITDGAFEDSFTSIYTAESLQKRWYSGTGDVLAQLSPVLQGVDSRWLCLRFFYDGQGFMSLQLTKTEAAVVFYDAFGSVLHRWRVTKELHSSI
ncbi:hypothetical protein GW17_00021509 [Ensete ventricosum]|nr:hypothetical protein GW17_00021509 [Ensete ventricosum]